MPAGSLATPARRLSTLWPWFVLLLATVPAVWHFVDFPADIDGEYPSVVRPTFSPRPPSAYRLAEPGDTIDRVALYVSAVVVVLSMIGWSVGRRANQWPCAYAIGLATGWFAATPGPCYDGWHGLGWRAIFDLNTPLGLRLVLIAAALTLMGVAGFSLRRVRWSEARSIADRRHVTGLLVFSVVAVALRAVEIPGVEPVGYWSRWCFAWGVLAFAMALVRLLPPAPRGLPRVGILGLGTVATLGIILVGLKVSWYHRPLERLRAVVPGRIYISAMPTYRGLEVEQKRLGFKTIVNLFPEETAQRSPRLPDELKFAREHGIRYVGSPGTAIDSDTFLDETLAIACDPSAWPILVHCHGCMDRSPAWMGIYRFAIQRRPLVEILREIEAHRGVRPKASVTLLYNRVLPPRAPEHYRTDPTASVLRENARGTVDPYDEAVRPRVAGPNPKGSGSVPRR